MAPPAQVLRKCVPFVSMGEDHGVASGGVTTCTVVLRNVPWCPSGPTLSWGGVRRQHSSQGHTSPSQRSRMTFLVAWGAQVVSKGGPSGRQCPPCLRTAPHRAVSDVSTAVLCGRSACLLPESRCRRDPAHRGRTRPGQPPPLTFPGLRPADVQRTRQGHRVYLHGPLLRHLRGLPGRRRKEGVSHCRYVGGCGRGLSLETVGTASSRPGTSAPRRLFPESLVRLRPPPLPHPPPLPRPSPAAAAEGGAPGGGRDSNR